MAKPTPQLDTRRQLIERALDELVTVEETGERQDLAQLVDVLNEYRPAAGAQQTYPMLTQVDACIIRAKGKAWWLWHQSTCLASAAHLTDLRRLLEIGLGLLLSIPFY